MLYEFERKELVLNRFFVKQLTDLDLTVYEYTCRFQKPPEPGDEQRAMARICYQLGVPATRLGSNIITQQSVNIDQLPNQDWNLQLVSQRTLNCRHSFERQGIERLERKKLERQLKRWTKTTLEKATEGGFIWWITGEAGLEQCGMGWAVHKGRRIDLDIDLDGNLYLEIDLHHRFYTPWTLHQWQEQYPDLAIQYVRNTYPDQKNNYITWLYQYTSEQVPTEIRIDSLGISLADYHRQTRATEEEIQNSRVVYVKRANQWNAQTVPHLSQRLSPSITMEMLANLAEQSNSLEKNKIDSVYTSLKKRLETRIKEAENTAQKIFKDIYKIATIPQALEVQGYSLPKAQLFALKGKVDKAAEVRAKGCIKVGETHFGCLNLFNNKLTYPLEVEKCLKDVAQKSNTPITLDSYRILNQWPEGKLDRQMFWQEWSNEGIKTILVVMPRSFPIDKQDIRKEALQAGIATQFMVPLPKADRYKAMNVVLGLLCKAGWQPIRLEPLNHPEAADLILGFDTGKNRELYYGTSAFAVLANGQSLGWELPDIQRGERFSGENIWQTVGKIILKFHQVCRRYPKKLLLMRDGLIQAGEFDLTIQALGEKGIAVDILGIRKSGVGRIGCEVSHQGGDTLYQDAPIGSVIFLPKERSFLLVTSQPVGKIGSVRPLRVIHDYGETPLELLALQTYHLTQLHPASGFRSCRLPWVLHLADRSSKEFQRIGQMSILQNLSREKLIAV